MIPVLIELRRKKKLRQYITQLPQSWEEIPPSLRLICVRFFIDNPPAEARLQVARLILGLPEPVFRGLSNSQIEDIVSQLAWVELSSSATPLIDSFQHRQTTRLLPQPQFMDGTCLEFALADEFYTEYLNGDTNSLLRLAATLCHRATKRGNRKPLTDRTEALQLADSFQDLNPAIVTAVLLYFSGVKQRIYEIYGNYLFASNDESDESDPSDNQGTMFGWWGAFMDVAESGVFGNLDQVYQTSFHSVCMYMVKKKKEANDIEVRRQIEETRNQHR